ncbi:helix-turn-helix transcriptional regulator [Nonomuraea sp. NPDC049750]|uniref:helix-turn-helix domain-containing protein n=1 Tax=Nonomuraea sp. NPDC049750 TaxID=3154738 RepID=UPI0033E154FC
MDRDIAALLGIDPDDPEVQRENAAIERDVRLIETLVGVRKLLGLTQADVADKMDRSQPAVSDFERLGGDPRLSTIRRYALAIGAEVFHVVKTPGASACGTTSTSAHVVIEGLTGTVSPPPTRAAGALEWKRAVQ